MKLLDLDPKFRRWDKYREFHMNVGQHGAIDNTYSAAPFVQFETGEVVCTLSDPNPNFRGEYSALNLAVYKTQDKRCPKLFFRNGTPISRAWLETRGQPTLLLDRCTTRAVGIRRPTDKDPTDHLPERFVNKIFYRNPDTAPARIPKFSAYFAGEGRDPHGSPIEVVPPLNISLTPDEFAHVKDITAACKAWYAMTDHADKNKFGGPPVHHNDLLQVPSINEIPHNVRCAIVERGVARKRMYEPYLVF